MPPFPSLLIACSLALVGAPDDPSPADLQTYAAARDAAGQDADAHVALALWCESRGLTSEFQKELALAVILQPDHPTARGLLGQLRANGSWIRPPALLQAEAAAADLTARRLEYQARRSRLGPSADDQQRLALWCEQNGLPDEARAHWTVLTRLEPGRTLAWRRLGYRKQRDGRWLTDQQLRDERDERQAQARADDHWRPVLSDAARDLASADQVLASVSDPRAVPSVWRVLATADEPRRARAVQVLGQIDSRNSSRALALLALFAPEAEIRRSSAETLQGRDPREFADLLLPWVRQPIEFEARPVDGPGSTGVLAIRGQAAEVQRLYSAPSAYLPLFPGDTLGLDPFGRPVIRRLTGFWQTGTLLRDPKALAALENVVRDDSTSSGSGTTGNDSTSGSGRNKSLYVGRRTFQIAEIPLGLLSQQMIAAAAATESQLESDIASLEAMNAEINEMTDRAQLVLSATTGLNLGADPLAWQNWYRGQLGFQPVASPPARALKPTIQQAVAPAYTPVMPPILFTGFSQTFSRVVSYSCFGAGTPVLTRQGTRPIESIQVGDQVLSQNPVTGELSYRPVVRVERNPPSQTLRVQAGDETFVTSVFHRFWRAGHGWSMARELVPGQKLRLLGNLVDVRSVEPGSVEPVFNLEVEGTHTFLIGGLGLLVHDTTVPDFRARPFDSVPVLPASD